MPQLGRRRRPEPEEEVSSDEDSPEPPTQRRRLSASPDNDAFNNGATQADSGNLNTMVKKMVRLALACEYQRKPIRRADVSEKVLGTASRQFRKVFDQAQEELRTVFGMEMKELPARDKVTMQQRRAAAKSQDKAKTTTASWVLVSTLPSEYHHQEILPPARIPTEGEELKYTALYSVIVSAISLNGGELADSRLERYMKRLRIDERTPLGDGKEVTPPVLMKRMERDGYIVRVRETGPGGEEDVRWIVGPRGKVEIGDQGVQGLTEAVYGNPEGDDGDDLQRRIGRSLGIGERMADRQKQTANGAEKKKRGRKARDQQQGDEEEEEDEESEGSD